MQCAVEWMPIRLGTATFPSFTDVSSWSGFFYPPFGPIWIGSRMLLANHTSSVICGRRHDAGSVSLSAVACRRL